MDTNERPLNSQRLLFKDEVFRMAGCSFEVLKEIGHGLHEKVYENARAVEFKRQAIAFAQQPSFPVLSKASEWENLSRT